MIKKILEILDMGRTHENVGRIFYSPFFDEHIIVTAYKSDENWKFKFYKHHQKREFQAESKLSYFLENDLEREKT